MEYPLLVEEYALVDDSGGPGKFRGGLGIRRTIQVLDHEAQFLGTLERAEIAPWGLQGGGPGGCAALVLNPGRPAERRVPSKVWGYALKPGDRIQVITPGAGGYGPALERSSEALTRDLADGKVSPARARAEYRMPLLPDELGSG
jgi:N-methylhydantoinase B